MNFRSEQQRRVAPFAFALAVVSLLAATSAFADGTTERERTMSRYAKCKWTDSMSKELYECVKRNNGFNTHWCFDETLQMNCEPEPLPGVADAVTNVAQAGEPQREEVQIIEVESFADENMTRQEDMAHHEDMAQQEDVSQEEARKRAARQGEENLHGTIEREQTMLKYKDCKWTDEMGKYTYECVKRNNGFGTHWCYDEALQLHCPKPGAEPKS